MSPKKQINNRKNLLRRYISIAIGWLILWLISKPNAMNFVLLHETLFFPVHITAVFSTLLGSSREIEKAFYRFTVFPFCVVNPIGWALIAGTLNYFHKKDTIENLGIILLLYLLSFICFVIALLPLIWMVSGYAEPGSYVGFIVVLSIPILFILLPLLISNGLLTRFIVISPLSFIFGSLAVIPFAVSFITLPKIKNRKLFAILLLSFCSLVLTAYNMSWNSWSLIWGLAILILLGSAYVWREEKAEGGIYFFIATTGFVIASMFWVSPHVQIELQNKKMERIHAAMLHYATDHEGQYPLELQSLQNYGIHTHRGYGSYLFTYWASIITPQISSEYRSILPFYSRGDFYFLHPGMNLDSAPALIIAFSKPYRWNDFAGYKSGCSVLLNTGNAEWWDETRFLDTISHHNDLRRQHNLEPFTMDDFDCWWHPDPNSSGVRYNAERKQNTQKKLLPFVLFLILCGQSVCLLLIEKESP